MLPYQDSWLSRVKRAQTLTRASTSKSSSVSPSRGSKQHHDAQWNGFFFQDVDWSDSYGCECTDDWTALLHEAAEEGRHEYCSLLIQRGAPVDGRDSWARTTALHKCIRACAEGDGWKGWGVPEDAKSDDTGKLKAADVLLRMGANVEVKDKDGFTPLLRAAQRGHLRMVQLLLSHGSSPGNGNEHGTNPENDGRHSDRTNPLQACFENQVAEGPKLEIVRAICEAGAPAEHVLNALTRARRLAKAREACLQQSIADQDLEQFVFSDRSALEDAVQVVEYLEARNAHALQPSGS